MTYGVITSAFSWALLVLFYSNKQSPLHGTNPKETVLVLKKSSTVQRYTVMMALRDTVLNIALKTLDILQLWIHPMTYHVYIPGNYSSSLAVLAHDYKSTYICNIGP